jgi:hypothetical protein
MNTRRSGSTPKSAARGKNSRAVPIAAGLLIVALLAMIAIVIAADLGGPVDVPAPSGSDPIASLDAAGLPAAELDPDFPAFPIPAGAVLVNAQVLDGRGPGASRIAAWASPAGYDATVAFYTGLTDPRWTRSGSPESTTSATKITLADATGVLGAAVVQVSRTQPVRISVAFSAVAPPSAAAESPGATMAFSTLPPATTLPDGFPARLVPAGATLVDAAGIAGTFDAIFSAPGDPAALSAAYQTALAGYATGASVRAEGSAIVIDFTLPGGPGRIVLIAEAGGTSVAVEVRP